MFFDVDISDESLSMTAEVNSDLINTGGLELHRASVNDLPFGNSSFDIVTAVNTYFFWPAFAAGVAEIARVLNLDDVLAIARRSGTSMTTTPV